MDATPEQVNEYDKACERFELISRNIAKIIAASESVIAWAYGEYADAQADCAKYEIKPGIPLPQFRHTAGG